MSQSSRPAVPVPPEAGRARYAGLPVPPVSLVLGAALSVQIGATIAQGLFGVVGPAGATELRVGLAAALLAVSLRPDVRGYSLRVYALAALFGLITAAMNLSFYAALDRIPLGAAVTVEFVGPLGVAVLGSRKPIHLLWVSLAAAGILLLAPWGGNHLNGVGLLFALGAGVMWGCYVLVGARVGQVLPGTTGLTLAMAAGGLALLPLGIATAGTHLLTPGALLGGLGVALLSAVLPYSMELEALRHIPTRVFGVLLSLEPVVAALVGLVVLHQLLNPREVVALVLVTCASIGATRSGSATPVTND